MKIVLRNRLSVMGLFFSSQWHWIATALIVTIAVVVFRLSADLAHAAEVGEFIAGFSSALAFLWLIVGLRSQASDLALQRQELALQRTALEKQAKELKNSSKFASLAQIEAILDRAKNRLRESGSGIKEPSEIATSWMMGMKHWKEVLESRDAQVVQSRYMEWLKIESAARGYLSGVALALKLYIEHHLEAPLDQTKTDEEFVYIYSTQMNKAPFLSEHAGTAFIVADLVFMSSPGLEAMKVGGMFAMAKELGKSAFKEGALAQMRDELVKKDIPVPRIATD